MANLLLSPKFSDSPGGAFQQQVRPWMSTATILASRMQRRDQIRNAFASRSLAGFGYGVSGLGMTADEARRILAVGTYGGTYTQAQVDEAQRVYYGAPAVAATATTAAQPAVTGAYYQQESVIRGAMQQDCGSDPISPQVTLMSSPTCQPTDNVCIALLQRIEEYNNALQRDSVKKWERAWCEKQNCQNMGSSGYPRNCAALYPAVAIPPKPVYADERAILQQGGIVTGYSNQPIGTTVVAGAQSRPIPPPQTPATPNAAPPKQTADGTQPGVVPTGGGTSSAATRILDSMQQDVSIGDDSFPMWMLLAAGVAAFMFMKGRG